MIWKPIDVVWWGNSECIREVGDSARVVLNLADNIQDKDYRVGQLPAHILYYRYAVDEHQPPTALHLDLLHELFITVKKRKLFPLLIHCRAGQHRSPCVAACAIKAVTGLELEEALSLVAALRPDMVKNWAYSSGLLEAFR